MTLRVVQVIGPEGLVFGAGIAALHAMEIDGRRVLYAATGPEGGLTALEIGAGGALSVIDEVAIGGALAAGLGVDLVAVDGAGGPVLLMAGQDPAGRTLTETGAFGAAVDLGAPAPVLAAPSALETGSGAWIVTATQSGIALLAWLPDGSVTHAAALDDTADLPLGDVAATVIVARPEGALIVAAAPGEAGVTSLRAGPTGTLEAVDWLGAADGLPLTGVQVLDAIALGGRDLVIAGAGGASALAVFELSQTGDLALADLVIDSPGTRFEGATALDAVDVRGTGYLAAGGADDGVSLFQILPDGRLVLLETLADSTDATLADVSAVTITPVAGGLSLAVASASEPGLTRLRYDLPDPGLVLTGGPAHEGLAGGAGGDVLWGAGGDDVLSGGEGADLLADGDGADSLTGGPGADIFVLAADGRIDRIEDFEPGLDRLDLSGFRQLYEAGQLGVSPLTGGIDISFRDERILVFSASGAELELSDLGDLGLALDRPLLLTADQRIDGSEGADTLTGGLGDDRLTGFGGDDVLTGRDGDDTLSGGTGEDRLDGGAGADTIDGDAGFDTIFGGPGDDLLRGGAQADTIEGGAGDDRLEGGDGLDSLFGGDGADRIEGGDGPDRAWGGAGDDLIYGGFQEDRLYGEAGHDTILGDGGFDLLDGGTGDDTLNGGGQADTLWGGAGADRLLGEGGFDRLFGGDGADALYGGDGDDALFGEAGADRLDGQDGDDRLNGGPGDDILSGGAGTDVLAGGAGFDRIHAGPGDDVLSGNFNADTFVAVTGFGADTITDFEARNDFERIDLSGVAAIEDWADLRDAHLVSDGADVLIDAGDGDVLRLSGVDLADLDPWDFLF